MNMSSPVMSNNKDNKIKIKEQGQVGQILIKMDYHMKI